MFKFNNISSEEMKVVCEEEVNLIKKASKLFEEVIEGENSDLDYVEYGYSNVDGSLKLFILDNSKIDDIKKWLNGKGIIEYKGKVTTCAFFDSYPIERSATIHTISINFIRSPYWHKKDDDFVECEDVIENEGTVVSYPILRLEKQESDIIELSINNSRFSYTFPQDEEFVDIDCKDGNAYYNGLFRNNNLSITYDFPKLNPGENNLIIHQGDAKIKIKGKDVWL